VFTISIYQDRIVKSIKKRDREIIEYKSKVIEINNNLRLVFYNFPIPLLNTLKDTVSTTSLDSIIDIAFQIQNRRFKERIYY
jgi:hypothetical protein